MDIVVILLSCFVAILALIGIVLGVVLYGIGELFGGIIWLILGAAIGIAIFKKIKGS